MNSNARHVSVFLAVCICCTTPLAADANPFIGRWALTIPGGGAGWLGVEQKGDDRPEASILWGGGSVVPTAGADIDGDILYVVRSRRVRRKDASSNTVYVDRARASHIVLPLVPVPSLRAL